MEAAGNYIELTGDGIYRKGPVQLGRNWRTHDMAPRIRAWIIELQFGIAMVGDNKKMVVQHNGEPSPALPHPDAHLVPAVEHGVIDLAAGAKVKGPRPALGQMELPVEHCGVVAGNVGAHIGNGAPLIGGGVVGLSGAEVGTGIHASAARSVDTAIDFNASEKGTRRPHAPYGAPAVSVGLEFQDRIHRAINVGAHSPADVENARGRN